MDKSSKTLIIVVVSASTIVALGLIALAVVLSQPADPVVGVNSFRPSVYRKYSSFAVTSDSPLCSQIGRSIFEKNGSAVDVSIATMICIGVASLYSSGIGGGHLAIIYDTPRNGSRKVLTTLVARERAPLKATENMFQNASSQIGGLAIAVPGEIKGFYSAWEKFGRLQWSDLFEPTIKLLENGSFKVERALARAISRDYKKQLLNSPSLMAVYTKNNGSLLEFGDVIVDPKLAATFRNISADPKSFYEGPLAKEIVKEIQSAGGIITEEDLRKYEVEWKEPTAIKLQGTNLTHHSLKPPSSGVVLGLILNILAGYKMKPNAFASENMALTYHRLVEAFKYSYAGRSMLGDENFVNVTQLVEEMSSTQFAEFIRVKIDDRKTYDNASHYMDAYNQFEDHGTAHISVYGPDGSAVAMTSTINIGFGSTIKGSQTSILYNDEMDDFSSSLLSNFYGYAPSANNFIQPGKIPLSSMSPTFIMDSQQNIKLISGASGGSRIVTAIAGVTMNSLWANETLDKSVDRARVHHQLLPSNLTYEEWLDPMYINELKSKGHTMQSAEYLAILNTIKVNCAGVDCIEAVADGRKGGEPNGV
ncbi:hypothetical protein HELRODRAFT_162425 [Helobdella robusta]|uniref:Gamma-glutamyltransferase n=1 Tax=Helobdella robusta TaxID=6412 RepID=T1ESM9_HELRO|nr:hypothetical protein HELRODRAFT_162425 [Helobdella robusta]ESN98953.1 hypothetical protein HELRODRAFT_162425 [Helobdella robusta]